MTDPRSTLTITDLSTSVVNAIRVYPHGRLNFVPSGTDETAGKRRTDNSGGRADNRKRGEFLRAGRIAPFIVAMRGRSSRMLRSDGRGSIDYADREEDNRTRRA